VKVEPTVLLPKEWRCSHDQWLHSAMQAVIGDDKALELENMELYKETKRGVFDDKFNIHSR